MRRAWLSLSLLSLSACPQPTFDLGLTWDESPRVYETSSFRADKGRFQKSAPGTAVVVLNERAGFDVSLVNRPAVMRALRADLATSATQELGTPLPTPTRGFNLGFPLGDPRLQVAYSDALELAVLEGDAWTPRPFPPIAIGDVRQFYVLNADVVVVATPTGFLGLSGSTWKALAPEFGLSLRLIAYENGTLRVAGELAGKVVLALLDAATGQRVAPDVELTRPFGAPFFAGFHGTVNDFVIIGTETFGSITTPRPLRFHDGVLEPIYALPQPVGSDADTRFLHPLAFRAVLVGVVDLPPVTQLEATRPLVLGRPGFSIAETPFVDVIAPPVSLSILECNAAPNCPEYTNCRPNQDDNGKGCYLDPPTATVTWRLALPPQTTSDDLVLRIVSSTNPTAGPAPAAYVKVGAEWEVRLQPNREVLIDFVIAGGQQVNRRVMVGAAGSVTDLGTISLERRIEQSLYLDREVVGTPSMMDPTGALLLVSGGEWKLLTSPTQPLLRLGDASDLPGAPVVFPAGGALLVTFADGRVVYERAAALQLQVEVGANNPRPGDLVMAREAHAFVLPTLSPVAGQHPARFASASPINSDRIQTFNQPGDSNAVAPNGLWFARRQGTALAVHDLAGARVTFGVTFAQPVKLMVTNDGNRVAVLEGACVTSPGAQCTVHLVLRSQPSTLVPISTAATRAFLNEAGTVFLLEEGAALVRFDVASGIRTPMVLPQGFVIDRSAQQADRLVLLGVDRTVVTLDVTTGPVVRVLTPRARAALSSAGRVTLADACSGADPCAASVYVPWNDLLTDGAPGSARGPFIGAPADRTVTISGAQVVVTTPGAMPPDRVVDEVPGAMPTFDPLFDDVLTTAGAPCALFHRNGVRLCAF